MLGYITTVNFTRYFYGLLVEPVLKRNKSLSIEQARLVFVKSLDDYFQERISTNYLASVATQLYYQLLKPSDYYLNPVSHELGKVLDYTVN